MLKHMAIAFASRYESPSSTEAKLIRINYITSCITVFESAKDSCFRILNDGCGESSIKEISFFKKNKYLYSIFCKCHC